MGERSRRKSDRGGASSLARARCRPRLLRTFLKRPRLPIPTADHGLWRAVPSPAGGVQVHRPPRTRTRAWQANGKAGPPPSAYRAGPATLANIRAFLNTAKLPAITQTAGCARHALHVHEHTTHQHPRSTLPGLGGHTWPPRAQAEVLTCRPGACSSQELRGRFHVLRENRAAQGLGFSLFSVVEKGASSAPSFLS